MIWSVMLGFVLTSVFFFFGIRQRMTIQVQRDTAEILNAKAYLEAYADYLENETRQNPREFKREFDGIQGVVTQKLTEIEGAVDFGESKVYTFNADIFVAWNLCKDGKASEQGDLKLNKVIYDKNTNATGCQNNKKFNNVAGPISINSQTQLNLQTLNHPFHYQLTEKNGKTLTDNQWHMELKKALDYGREVTVRRVFK